MLPEKPDLVIYQKLHDFLQILKFASSEDHKVIEKLLDLHKTDPDRALALLDTLLSSIVTNQDTQDLAPGLERNLHSEKRDVPLVFYS